MKKYGATEVYKLGIGSDDQDNIIEYFNNWKNGIWPVLAEQFGSGEMKVEEEDINVDDEDLDDTDRKLPFEGIMSSFYKEKPFNTHAGGKYQFKAKSFLSYDTMRIGKEPSCLTSNSQHHGAERRAIFHKLHQAGGDSRG